VLVRLVGLGALTAAGVLIAYGVVSGPSYSDGPVPSVRDALSCDGPVYSIHQTPRGEQTLWQSTPESALQVGLLQGEQWSVDPTAVDVASRKEGRVLFAYDVDGRTRFAALVENGRGRRAQQWRLAAWAMCDPAELAGDGADRLRYGVWLDADGDAVSTSEVMTLEGAQRCGWQDVTFIEVGRSSTRPRQFVDDRSGTLHEPLRASYAARSRLPGDAKDTGWRRGGYALWLQGGGDAAYLVNLADPTDVERWPRTRKLLACS
jgi:hypothetical protein